MTARDWVYDIFSDQFMMILAVVGTVIIAVEYLNLAGVWGYVLPYFDWLIWVFFLAEFVLKVLVEPDKTAYIRTNKLNSAISIVIIVTPLASILAVGEAVIPAPLRLLRLVNLFRGGVYGGEVVEKKKDDVVKPKPKAGDEDLGSMPRAPGSF